MFSLCHTYVHYVCRKENFQAGTKYNAVIEKLQISPELCWGEMRYPVYSALCLLCHFKRLHQLMLPL